MSQRAEQLAEILIREFNTFLIKDAEPPRDIFITLTGVTMTDDLENALIQVSVLPVNKSGTALEFLKKVTPAALRYLGKHMVLRILPRLRYQVDDFALKHRNVERALEEDQE